MGRAIVREPQVFLMDEPLSNLDAKLRVQMRAEMAKLQHDLGVTTIYVTHDQVEAMTMGDRVAVMSMGKLQQVDTPQSLYDEPANMFVAGFIGTPPMNLVESVVHVEQDVVTVTIGPTTLPVGPSALERYPGVRELRRAHGRARHARGGPLSGLAAARLPDLRRADRPRRGARLGRDGVLHDRREGGAHGGPRDEGGRADRGQRRASPRRVRT